jgi:hypothetical protein
MKINFNSMNLGLCGGNRFILELANRLVDGGHEVTITHAGMSYYKDWFSPIKADVIECGLGVVARALNKFGVRKVDVLAEQQKRLSECSPECDVNVATFWSTAKPTYESGKGRGYYLVQHYEPSFYPEGSLQHAKAAETYDYPLTKLCVSQWLANKVGGLNIGNGINLEKFRRNPSLAKIPNSVMFSKRSAGWKNSDLGVAVASKLEAEGYKVMLTSEDVSDDEMVRLYNQAEVYVNLSDKEGFGYAPLEAMNCGAVVVSTPCSDYLLNGMNCMTVPFGSTASDVANHVAALLAEPAELAELRFAGYETAHKFDFRNVVDAFLSAIQSPTSLLPKATVFVSIGDENGVEIEEAKFG